MAAARARHSDATKRRAVAYAVKVGNVSQAAERFEVWESLIRRWSKDPRYGGKASNFSKGKPNGRTNSAGLPVNVAPSKRPKGVRVAVPVVFACPHCGQFQRIGGDS